MRHRLIGISAVGAAVFTIIFFVLFYTPEAAWVRTHPIGEKVSYEPFRAALSECLKNNDPSAYPEFAKTGQYKISGWFVPESPERIKVSFCMGPKDWIIIPVHLNTL